VNISYVVINYQKTGPHMFQNQSNQEVDPRLQKTPKRGIKGMPLEVSRLNANDGFTHPLIEQHNYGSAQVTLLS
jgi:hypothetical protein